jgi:glycosyltransferase involved in cell wall biosynthesis
MLNEHDTKPLVSIITVTYNSARYLNDALDSILTQAYSNFECIVSDDGSVDDTFAILETYQDPRIRKFRNQENLGEYANRNHAVSLARGKYIFFIDGDDIVLYRGIEDAVREMERYPDCFMAIVKPENPKYIGPLRISRKDALNLEFDGGGILDSSLANNVFHTKFLQAHPFFTEFSNSDKYSRIAFLETTDLLVLISPIAVWRQSHQQTSKSISLERSYWEFLSFCKNILFVNAGLSKHISPESLRIRYYRTLMRSIQHKLLSLRLAGLWAYRRFLLDRPSDVARYVLGREKNDFWNTFNYDNINIEFRLKKNETAPGDQR